MRLRLVDTARRVQARLQLGASGWLAYFLGATALAGSLAVFADATEDVTQHNGLTVHDAANLAIVVRHRSDVLVQASKVVTNFGGAGVVVAVAAIAGLVLWRRGLGLVLALAPGLAAGLAVAAVAIVKAVVGRARPPVGLHLVSERDASFPSGHATDSTAVLLTVAILLAVFVFRRPIARVLVVASAGLIAGAIGTSRLVLGVHWPSDVLAGWALGFSVALAVTLGASLLSRSRGAYGTDAFRVSQLRV